MKAKATIGVFASGALLSCAGALGEPEPEIDQTALADRTGAPIIATLQTRDGVVAISSAGGHVRYTLLAEDGGEQSLRLEELQSYDRELFELLQQATAGRAAPAALDASLFGSPALDASRGGSSGRFAGGSSSSTDRGLRGKH